ncbi:MAG TPA: beta-hydroxyacyl-ACP dehydratase [Nitrospirae bacterium]|nr:3-hydroxyacyl-[acyl-carrier-protein] dehydratase FabZ [bacterium BMS3Abin10]GBE38068.1 3-hydroxyacyl-[acyl-carrier-protein] dehydratase FabZ [bacterium BMS3Bbin08]HDK17527.1 beta-hydroxyacyl-ACP dehydratase [Nitrospirota bacterium]HDK81371.1 beta-hydroxyacyl-ACP dehydratase [Nitrospirota bacterium]
MRLGIEQIRSILPQREPFLFIDEVIEIDGTNKVVAVRDIRGDEDFFKGHFPNRPIMPGVLIIEALAQTAIILYSVCKLDIARTNPDYYLGRVKAEFLSPVVPGDRLILEANNVKITDEAGIADAQARVGDRIVAKASLVFGIKPREISQ